MSSFREVDVTFSVDYTDLKGQGLKSPRPKVLKSPRFSFFLSFPGFFCSREIEFALEHRGLRVQRSSQNTTDSLVPRSKYYSNKLVFMYVLAGSCHACGTFRLLAHTCTCTHAHNSELQG
jgi:hypothetical protein